MFLGLLLIALCISLWISWPAVLWCALVAAFPKHLHQTYIAQYCRRKQLNSVQCPRAFIFYGPVLFVTTFVRELGLCVAARQVKAPAPCRTALQTWCTFQTAKKIPTQPGSQTRR
jgi:hypothetical protein